MESVPRLDIPDGFDWNINNQSSSIVNISRESISNDDSDSETKDCPSKEKKLKLKKEIFNEDNHFKVGLFEESSFKYQDLETVDECDRLVLAFPNSSKAWLLYMVFHLKQAEVDKARTVAEKALKTISFRNDQEKYNIWVAYLNVENLYGTQESLMNIFQRAVTYCDTKKVYNHLVDIYLQSEKMEEAEQLLLTMAKKFKQEKEVWIKFGLHYMRCGKQELARKLMDRSFKSLGKKCHADVIGKFAHMEFEYGDAERGKSMFENILSTYPKRRDLRSIYISILRKNGYSEEANMLDMQSKFR